MLKILIVDDETPIREWIHFCIQKSPVSYDVVGLASNGQEALEIFNEKLPDIVFTDIKMPLMDGMELLKKIKSQKPSTEIVILTCHSDFEYARQAVKFGAKEYILKTEINDRVIYDLLKKFEESIYATHKLRNEELNSMHLKMEAFMRNYILNKQSQANANITEDELRTYNIPVRDGFLFSMALKFPQNMLKDFTENFTIPKAEGIENIFGFTFDKDTFILMGNISGTPSTLLQINKTYEFALLLKKYNSCTIGLSNIYNGLKKMRTTIEEALKQLDFAFYTGEGTINRKSTSQDSSQVLLQMNDRIQGMMAEARQKGMDSIKENIIAWFSIAEEKGILSITDLKKLCLRILQFTLSQTGLNRDSVNYMQSVEEDIADIQLFGELKKYTVSKVEQLLNSMRQKESNYSYAVSKAVRYIRDHYAEAVSLTQVAEYVNLNTDYFCRRFKEETGNNFSNFLTKIRLEKARELLKTTNMKVYEIAECVGYENLSYFSTIFKKYYSVNPFDFRNGIED